MIAASGRSALNSRAVISACTAVSLDAWITLFVLVFLVVAMVREVTSPAVATLVAAVVLLLAGVIDGDQAFAGFSNEAPIVVASLLVLARAVDVSGVMAPVVRVLFGRVANRAVLLARVVFPVAAISAFINNTTVVAMTVPAVLELC